MQKVIRHRLSFCRLIIKITVNIFLEMGSSYLSLLSSSLCCWLFFLFVCFIFFSPTLPHFTRVEKCESYYGNRNEMIFCSHSARQIGEDVIHLGCRPCCKCIILPQPHSTICTQRFTFPGMGSVLLSLLSGHCLALQCVPAKWVHQSVYLGVHGR